MSNAITFAIGPVGRFFAYRGTVLIGGIDFRPGGWVAYERTQTGCMWTPHGRISAHFAARDLWGKSAGNEVLRLPDNRPEIEHPDAPTKNWRRNWRIKTIGDDHHVGT